MRVFEVTSSKGSVSYVTDRPQDVGEFLASDIEGEEVERDDAWTVRVIEMPEEVFENLDEWGGW